MTDQQYEEISVKGVCPDCEHEFNVAGSTRWFNNDALQYQLDTLLREHASVCPKTHPSAQQDA